MVDLGFRPVVSTPCLYYHPSWGIRVVGHVDDLMCVGPRSGLDTFLEKVKCVYELSSTFLGPRCWRRTERESFLHEAFVGEPIV